MTMTMTITILRLMIKCMINDKAEKMIVIHN